MKIAYVLTPFWLLASAAALAALTASSAAREARAIEWDKRRLVRLCGLLLVWAAVTLAIHFTHARQHRLYFDEDVYANISRNITEGYGATVTVARAENFKDARPYKWPGGFPALAAPWVAWLGTERGPAAFNEICGAATLAVLMGFASRLSASWLAGVAVAVLCGLHPLAGGWYRSGSAEPLALLLSLVALWAATEHAATGEKKGRGEWAVVSLLAALAAAHTRLESALVFVPLALLLWRPRPALRVRHVLLLVLLGAPMLASLFLHVLTLKNFYLVGLPESSFSTRYLFDNMTGNAGFLLTQAGMPLAILAFAAVLSATLPAKPRARGRAGAAAVLWLVLNFVLLGFYSVGQYGAPGGSRFALLPLAVLALLASVALGELPAQRRGGGWLAASALALALCVSWVSKHATWRALDAQTESPRIEHEAVRAWAGTLPRGAVVVSRVPFLWENLGVNAVAPEHARALQRSGAVASHIHYGLFDSANSERPAQELLAGEATTEHGRVTLYRLPRPHDDAGGRTEQHPY